MSKTDGAIWLVCLGFVLGLAAADGQTAHGNTVHNFGNAPPKGGEPTAITRAADGNFYGTAAIGGPFDTGVVFKLDSTGRETVLYNFRGAPDGEGPNALVSDTAGNLYGTTAYGGAKQVGTIFMLAPDGHETILYSFAGGADGGEPAGGLIRDPAGNFYGVTAAGGVSGTGVVYKLDATGDLTVLHSFTGGVDGASPNPGLVIDSAGVLYGTTYGGGKNTCYEVILGCGVIYELAPGRSEQVLYNFTFDNGSNPRSGLIHDAAGNLYGTTTTGGANGNFGTIYELDTTNQFTVLHDFTHGEGGAWAGLTRDPAGNLFGTTLETIFELSAVGEYTQLHRFNPTNGLEVETGVIEDSAGNLYGSTYSGGVGNSGVIYKCTRGGQYTVMYGFPDPPSTDGSGARSGLVGDGAGNLYGTTVDGGTSNAGTVYKVDPSGNETVLYNFMGESDGAYPWAGLARDAAGNLYGTTANGGTGSFAGVVYKFGANGSYTVLYTFTGGADGGNPYAGVSIDVAGNLYGTASAGGNANAGVVYKIDTAGNYSVLYNFTGGTDGNRPVTGVVQDAAGNLYGTTEAGGTGNAGVVFRLDAAANETVLYSFSGGPDGSDPSALFLGPSGIIRGTTLYGGINNAGVVYELDLTGHETLLYTFTGGADGANPLGPIIADAAGNLYGTAIAGGAANLGVVFTLDGSGHETVLYSFNGTDGALPEGGVIRNAAGNVFGTTWTGGERAGGVIFEVHPSGAPGDAGGKPVITKATGASL